MDATSQKTSKFSVVVSLDYELPEGGRGDVREQMIDSTARLLEVSEKSGAPLTIMMEMAELWAFEKAENRGFKKLLDYDPASAIRAQLVDAVKRGHDVQLHMHPQWLGATWREDVWELDYAHYSLTDYEDEEIVDALRRGKGDLEAMLQPHCAEYECIGFRSGHWNTEPSDRYLSILREAGLKSDTSVFKWGYANNAAGGFDYRNAFSNVCAWYASSKDINQSTSMGEILEVPIATELTTLLGMLTPRRVWLARQFLREEGRIRTAVRESRESSIESEGSLPRIRRLFGLHPKKLDFCKLTGRQMLRIVRKLMAQCEAKGGVLPIPLMMIGHSKQSGAEEGLGMFLETVRSEFSECIRFSTYRSFVDEYEIAARGAKQVATSSLGGSTADAC